ncbi:MAG: type I restriction endonuclease subunit R [Bacteroidia bacterium]
MSEYTFVEKPFLKQLHNLGWQVHDLGEGIPQDPTTSFRSSFKEVALKNEFIKNVIQINRDENENIWLTEKQVSDLFYELYEQRNASLLEANKALYHKLVDDYPRVDKNEITGEESPVVKLIDFSNPKNNSFVAINQFRVDTPGHTKSSIRPDIILFINGLPVVVVECKDSNVYTSNPIEEAYKQIQRYANQRYDDYNEGEESLFYFNQFNIITNGNEARLGTITSDLNYYYYWRDIYPDKYKAYEKPLGKDRAQEKLIQGVLPPETLLDLIAHCILYMQVGGGKEIKILARYQQYRAISKVAERLISGNTSKERSGVIWHTQGSGKSLTMVMLVRKLRSHSQLKDYKVLMVNDRTDLEKQLGDTATLTNEPVDKVSSIKELRTKLATPTSNVVMVMVHKFQEQKQKLDDVVSQTIAAEPMVHYGNFGVINETEKILILIDEAHRTQSSDLGNNLFEAFPNATYIAFTGTPLITDRHSGHKTFERFGSYIDKYKLQDAVDDGATLQILYEGKTADSALRNKLSFDQEFENLIKEHTEEEKESIRKRYGTYKDVMESDEMVSQKAKSMVHHYINNIYPEGFKAQVVTSSINAAVKYKKHLLEALANYNIDKIELDLSNEKKALLKELKVYAVVTSQGTNEHPSITEARKESSAHNAIENFKKGFNKEKPETLTAFLVVCDMLLTGFDAPVEQVMYLDKKMREHNLLQAIARVNRTHQGKTRGFIVDYVGLAHHLKEALQIYGGDVDDILESLRSLESEVPILEQRYTRLLNHFEAADIGDIEDFVLQRIKDVKEEYHVLEQCIELGREISFRAEFDVLLKNFFESLNIILPNKAAIPFKIPAKRFGYIYEQMKQRYKDATLNLGNVGDKVKGLVNKHLIGLGIDMSIPPVELFSNDFEKELNKKQSKKAVASEMEHAIRKHIKVSFEDDPALYQKLSEKLEQVIKKNRDNWEQQIIEFTAIKDDISQGRGNDKSGIESLILENLVRFATDEVGARKKLEQFTPTLIDLLKSYISIEHFWDKSSLVKELEAEIEQSFIIEDVSDYFNDTSALINDLMQLVKRRSTDILKYE